MLKKISLIAIAFFLCACAAQRAREQIKVDGEVLKEKILPIQTKLLSCIKESLSSRNTQLCARTAILENVSAPYPPNLIGLKALSTSFYEKVYSESLEYDASKITRQEYGDRCKRAAEKFSSSWKEMTSTEIENKYRANAGMQPKP